MLAPVTAPLADALGMACLKLSHPMTSPPTRYGTSDRSFNDDGLAANLAPK